MNNSTSKTAYLCSSCGNDFPKWFGQCPACHEWGTLAEYKQSKKKKGRGQTTRSDVTPLNDVVIDESGARISTRITEVDRVLGKGLLKGTLVLLGGHPGIGKSTLALQIVGGVEHSTLYVSAEESQEQIALRAKRLNIDTGKLSLSNENNVENIIEQIEIDKPDLVIIDSIQTVYVDTLDSMPGSISQVRESGQQFLQVCKQKRISIMIIGHVTKEGTIAGPKMLEHMVDTVLYLEGDERYDHRILRSVKNRFGATNEVGIFQMGEDGMAEVANPSELFLAEKIDNVPGSAVYPSMEGTRPILIEVQALVSKANFGNPQRNVNGIDLRRLAMLLAVLEKRLKIPMGMNDIFVNLVGGMRIDDPAADLAIISSIASSALNKSIPSDTILIGEVGLAGEVRSVSQLSKRLNEAEMLGFKKAFIPKFKSANSKYDPKKIEVERVSTVRDAFDNLF
ncbi:DNA repair protein RadA [Candidatus Neomarinimicrobiota bacterium]